MRTVIMGTSNKPNDASVCLPRESGDPGFSRISGSPLSRGRQLESFFRGTLLLAFCFLGASLANAQSAKQSGQAQVILDRFAQVLLVEFPMDSERQLVPLLHDSFKDNKLTWLLRQYRDLDFTRARRAISRYQIPIKIVRSKKYDQDGISLGPKKEIGELIDFYIAKKDPTGNPAPIKIFFPKPGSTESGSPSQGWPVIVSFGSL